MKKLPQELVLQTYNAVSIYKSINTPRMLMLPALAVVQKTKAGCNLNQNRKLVDCPRSQVLCKLFRHFILKLQSGRTQGADWETGRTIMYPSRVRGNQEKVNDVTSTCRRPTNKSLSPLPLYSAILKHPSSQSSIRAAKVQADKASCKAAAYSQTLPLPPTALCAQKPQISVCERER